MLSRIYADSNYVSNYDNIITKGEISEEVVEFNNETTTVSVVEDDIVTNKYGIVVGELPETTVEETQQNTEIIEEQENVE